MDLFLGIDFGTSGVRTSIIDQNKDITESVILLPKKILMDLNKNKKKRHAPINWEN